MPTHQTLCGSPPPRLRLIPPPPDRATLATAESFAVGVALRIHKRIPHSDCPGSCDPPFAQVSPCQWSQASPFSWPNFNSFHSSSSALRTDVLTTTKSSTNIMAAALAALAGPWEPVSFPPCTELVCEAGPTPSEIPCGFPLLNQNLRCLVAINCLVEEFKVFGGYKLPSWMPSWETWMKLASVLDGFLDPKKAPRKQCVTSGPTGTLIDHSLEDTNITKAKFNEIPSCNETIQHIQSLLVGGFNLFEKY